MIKSLKTWMLFLGAAAFISACGSKPKGEVVETAPEQEVTAPAEPETTTLAVNLTESSVGWTGMKKLGTETTGKHEGTINISSGQLMMAEGTLVGGKFVIDMNTINCTDLEDPEKKAQLEGHLASDDFFDIANHPTAEFEITSVETIVPDETAEEPSNATHKITGNFTLRGTTLSIPIEAGVSIENGQLVADSEFLFDRTQWGVMFKPEADVVDKTKDWFIRDEIAIKLHLVAAAEATASL